MNKSTDPRKRQRRPRRGEERDGADTKDKIDRDFAREIEMRVAYFLDSDEEELELEPMNSYRRRMVHTLAKNYNLHSESRGEDRERFVCLVRTEETTAAPSTGRKARLWDFGTQTFRVQPGPKGLRMALKVDGSVELWRESEKAHIIADRVLETTEFRIRQGKILVPGEAGY